MTPTQLDHDGKVWYSKEEMDDILQNIFHLANNAIYNGNETSQEFALRDIARIVCPCKEGSNIGLELLPKPIPEVPYSERIINAGYEVGTPMKYITSFDDVYENCFYVIKEITNDYVSFESNRKCVKLTSTAFLSFVNRHNITKD